MLHTCMPGRWRQRDGAATGSDTSDDVRHSIVSAGTTFGFAEAQLQAAVLTAFQVLLGNGPEIAAAIEEIGRFPSWESVAGDDADAASALLHILQCRRLAEVLMGGPEAACRAILTFVGWRRLASDEHWRAPLPSDEPPAAHADTAAVLEHWADAILEPVSPAPDTDSPREIRELAACSFRSLGLPGGMIATMAEQRLDGDDAPTTPTLMDALSGNAQARTIVWDRYHAMVGASRATARGLEAALVGALNPPLCLTLLERDDPIPNWDCLQPGRRFQRLCRGMAEEDPLPDRAGVEETEAFVDALCARSGWPRYSLHIERAKTARDDLAKTPALAAVTRWLADHWTRGEGSEPRVPPATYSCCRYVSFLDAFVTSRGGLVPARARADRPLFRCEPHAGLNERSAPTARLAVLLHHAAVLVVGDLVDGGLLTDAAARVLDPLRAAGWEGAAVPLAATLHLPSVAATLEGG